MELQQCSQTIALGHVRGFFAVEPIMAQAEKSMCLCQWNNYNRITTDF